MTGSIPFRIPVEFLSAHAAGEIVRYGAILKDSQTGKIVGHLQQTGLLDRALGAVANLDPTGITGIVGVVQNVQMSRQLSALQASVGAMKSLQLATLASSVAGIGVTAAATALILQRLKGIEGRITGLEGRIESLSGEVKLQSIQTVFSEISGAIDRVAVAEHRSNSAQTVQGAEERLHYSFYKLSDITGQVLQHEKLDVTLARSLLAGLSVCSAAHVKSLFWLNELSSAELQAGNHYGLVEKLSRNVTLDKLRPRLRHMDNSEEIAKGLLNDLKEVRARLASVPGLSCRLQALDCDGREYLGRLSEEKEVPLLVLPA